MSGTQPDPLQAALLERGRHPSSPPSGFPTAQLDDAFVDAFQIARPTTDYSYYLRVLLNSVLMMLADALALLLALVLGGMVRMLWRGDFMMADVGAMLIPAWWLGALLLRLTPGWGISAVEMVRRMVLLMALVLA